MIPLCCSPNSKPRTAHNIPEPSSFVSGYPFFEDSTAVMDTRFPLCAIRSELSLGAKTWAPVWSFVTWSMNCMYTGIAPTTGFDDQPLKRDALQTPGEPMYKGVGFRLTEIRGDWKAHQSIWGLMRAAFTSNNVCHVCEASRVNPSTSMLEFSRNPGWLATTRTHATFLSDLMNDDGCNLMYIRKFNFRMLRWCSMHSIQLGCGLFLNGGCWYELQKVGWFPGTTAHEQCRSAYRSFKSWLKTNKVECTQPAFKPWMFVCNAEESCSLRSKVVLQNFSGFAVKPQIQGPRP